MHEEEEEEEKKRTEGEGREIESEAGIWGFDVLPRCSSSEQASAPQTTAAAAVRSVSLQIRSLLHIQGVKT